jgi:hypothetical protein
MFRHRVFLFPCYILFALFYAEKTGSRRFAYPNAYGTSYARAIKNCITQSKKKEMDRMSTNNSNHLVNPAAREAMDKFKMEAASDLSVFFTS